MWFRDTGKCDTVLERCFHIFQYIQNRRLGMVPAEAHISR